MSRYKYTPEDTCVLAWCNEKRVEMGKEPVRWIRKGERRRPCHCALAKTIGEVSIGVDLRGKDYTFISNLPAYACQWIRQRRSPPLY